MMVVYLMAFLALSTVIAAIALPPLMRKKVEHLKTLAQTAPTLTAEIVRKPFGSKHREFVIRHRNPDTGVDEETRLFTSSTKRDLHVGHHVDIFLDAKLSCAYLDEDRNRWEYIEKPIKYVPILCLTSLPVYAYIIFLVISGQG